MPRLLLVAEAVTLAHIARPLALAPMFDTMGYEVVIACAPTAKRWLAMEGRPFEPIASISPQRFRRALSRGSPVYDAATLSRYVKEDLAIIDRVRPDLVIGDFRLTLYISSKLSHRPYGAITNAYWSPRHFKLGRVPDIPLVRLAGAALADRLFRLSYRLAFRWHAIPFALVCRQYDVPPPAGGLLGAYTASDCTAFADAEEFYSMPEQETKKASKNSVRAEVSKHERSFSSTVSSPSHSTFDATGAANWRVPDCERFIGPLEWSPKVPLPPGHERWGQDRPLIYVSLGSSGPPRTLGRVLKALADLQAHVVVAAAGASMTEDPPANATVLEYAPGAFLCQRASLVIGNGGSPIAYQCLRVGVPLLGLASNFDQFLNMRIVESMGSGRLLRASSATLGEIHRAALELLRDEETKAAAMRAARVLASYDTRARVADWLGALAGTSGAAP